MNCREFLDLLDGRERREPPEGIRGEHAESCPRCSFALRVERALEEAPSWAGRPVMNLEQRATVLAKARVRNLYWRQSSSLLQDAAVQSAVILVVLWLALTRLPGLLASNLPEEARESAARWVGPLAEQLDTFTRLFPPLLENPWGMALVLLSAFFITLAAVLCTRVLLPSRI